MNCPYNVEMYIEVIMQLSLKLQSGVLDQSIIMELFIWLWELALIWYFLKLYWGELFNGVIICLAIGICVYT